MKKFLSLLLALPLLASCSLGERSEEGYYGPFEMVIKAKDGAHVDDIIVTLAKVVPAHLEGSGHTYEATVVTSTDVPVTFPRGFVSYDKFDTLSLDISVSHPYYHYFPSDLSFRRQTEGPITLSDQYIISFSETKKLTLAKEETTWERNGLTEEEKKAKRQSFKVTARCPVRLSGGWIAHLAATIFCRLSRICLENYSKTFVIDHVACVFSCVVNGDCVFANQKTVGFCGHCKRHMFF